MKRFHIFFLSLCRGMTDVQFLCFESPTLHLSIHLTHHYLLYINIKCKRSCRWLLHRSAPVSASLSLQVTRYSKCVALDELRYFWQVFVIFYDIHHGTPSTTCSSSSIQDENATTMRVTHVDWWIDREKTPTNNLVLSNPWVHDGTRDQTTNRRRSVEVNERKTKVYEKFQ